MYRKLELFKNSSLIKSSSWMVFASGITSLLRFFLIFIVIHFYSKEEFGLWASITSIAAVLITGDFGITNVLRNLISKELQNGEEGNLKSKQYFYSAGYVFTIIAIVGSVLLLLLSNYIPYEYLFKTDNVTLKEQGRYICTYVQIIFLLNLPLGLGVPLFFSYGETKLYSIFSIIQGVAPFILVMLTAFLGIPIHIVSVLYFLVNSIVILCGTLLFIYKRNWYKPEIGIEEAFKNFGLMLPVGIKFMVIQLTSSFVSNVLTIYSGTLLSLDMAANVNLAQKIFSFFTGIYQSIFNPIWSHLSRLYYTNEIGKCHKLLQKSSVTTAIVVFGAISLVTIFRDILIDIIATDQYVSSASLFLLVGLFVASKLLFDNISLLHKASNRLNIIIIGYALFSAFVIWMVPMIANNYGFYKMTLSLVVCWGCFIAVVFVHLKFILLRQEM